MARKNLKRQASSKRQIESLSLIYNNNFVTSTKIRLNFCHLDSNLYFSITLEIDIQLNVANLYAVMREEKDMKLNSLRNWNINCEY